MGQHHQLQCETQYYQAVERGDMKFLVLLNEGFKVYDYIYLNEVVRGIPTGRKIGPLEITYVQGSEHTGIMTGFCVLNWR